MKNNDDKIPIMNKNENNQKNEEDKNINQNKIESIQDFNQKNIKEKISENEENQRSTKQKLFFNNKDIDIDNISDNSFETPRTVKIAKRVNNNKFIYSKEKNIFFVDANEDSDKEKDEKNKISRVNKNTVNKIYKNKENEIQNNSKKENISYSENEEIEDSEIEIVSNNEQEEEIEEISEEEESNNIKIKEEKNIYLLELDDNGLPNLQNEEILTCNINSILNISIYNGLPISKDICLLTNSEHEFPSPFFLEEIIEEINSKSQIIINKASPHTIKKQKFIFDENHNILKSLKKYRIYPCTINTKIYFRVSCKRPGNIYFVFMYKDSNDNKTKFTKSFNILVNPLINLNNKNLLDVNQIQIQSIIPKNIGCLNEDFEKYYEEASLLQYNFIHFHSFQELCSKNNIYIIKNQNELNDNLFLRENNGNLGTNEKYQLLNNSIKNLKNKYHIGAITDVVLSHTSSESKWIYQNKDFTYNLQNTPWLNVSYELDKILMNYSKLFSSKKVSYKSAPYIYNINNINQIISEISTYIEEANLHEFFMISEEKYVKKFQNFYQNIRKDEEFRKSFNIKKSILLKEITKAFIGDREDKLNEILSNINYMINLIIKSCINYGYERYGVKMCIEYVGILVIESYKEKNNIKKLPSENNFIKEIKAYINIINNKWIKETKELLKITLYNIKEYLRYKYIQLNNKKKITQLIDSYFVVKNENNPSEIFLSNGWIMNSENLDNPFANTVQYGSWYHLKRKVIIFKDTIKINYGTNMENVSNNLLDYMSKYISNLASIFDGLYIDSIGNIPIYVLKYLIYEVRKVNPSIILLCYVTRDNIKDGNNNSNNNMIALLKKRYVEELGINLFIDELIWDNNETEIINSIINKCSSCNSNIYPEIITHFSDNLYSSSFIDENNIKFGKFKYLKPKKPFNIIYDSYNNQTFYEKFKKLSLNLPILSLMGLIDTSIGTTYGFDSLYPILLPNIENDSQQYNINMEEMKKIIEKTNNTFKTNAEETYEVFFEYHPEGNQNLRNICSGIYSVDLALNLFDFKPNIRLTRIKKNLYMVKTRLPPGKYYYQFVINENIWVYDNTQLLEEDENGIVYNVIDLRSQNKIIIPDIKLFRKEINNVRNYFKNKKSEIYIQKNKDMISVIRMVTETKSLINNNLDENKVLKCKNKMDYLSEEGNNGNDSDYENVDEINNKIYKSPDIKKSKNNYNILAKSFEQENKLDESLLFNVNKNLENSINVNLETKEFNIDSFKKQNKKETSNKKILEASMEVNLNNSFANIKNIKELSNINEIYNGYAIISFPSFDKNNTVGKGEIIIPGKITELICACYFNGEKIDLYSNGVNKKIKFPRNEIYFTKDINYLKCISNIKYNQSLNRTTIEFYNAPQNISIIVKFINETKKIINTLDEYLEILFNKGYEFINYFDILEINKLLFRTEKEERINTNNKRGTYEMKINLFNDIYVSNNIINFKYDKNLKIKFMYAGINELVELIKIIKRSENQNLFYNLQNEFNTNINEKSLNSNIMFNSTEYKKIKIQSLYKDISTNDNYINYIIKRLGETKSFKLLYNLMKTIILPQYNLLPPFIKPIYFEKIIISLYQNIMRISLGKIPSYILNFGDFSIGLSLSIYEFIKKHISCSFNNRLIKKYDIKSIQNKYSNMAGLSVWSGLPINDRNNSINIRDILIGFKSLFLIPKLYYEGKIILKLIGSTMKYGLFPEQIDNSNTFNYKYYSRDISWFYIKAIKDYIYVTLDYNFLKEGIYLINLPENVNTTYLKKQKNNKNKKTYTVENIIQLIFQYHAQGINFIDKKREEQPSQKKHRKKNNNSIYMDLDPSKINIYLDLETGFIYGGNILNAGTWMNHIGSSKKAKNMNIPATPRDGADIEIIALLFNCLNFVVELNFKNYYYYKNVILNTNETFSFYQWSLLIKKYFEKKFYIDKTFASIQNKSPIYKDYIAKPNPILNTSNEAIDNDSNKNDPIISNEEKNELKLRPNVLLAIYYAPDLFSYQNILKILENIEKYLLRPEIQNQNKNINGIGICMNGVKTLDKTDIDYNGKIDFKESNNYKTSCGFNIHNGVEFVWLYGIYLMVKIKYAFNFNYDFIENNSKDSFIPEKTEEMVRYISKKLIGYIKYMKETRYMGVPEIIDEIGNVYNEGNQSDLKSMAMFLELINKLAWASDKIYNDVDNEEDDFSSKDGE